MKTIVALVDFSDVTRAVLEQASQLHTALSGRLILLHVVPEQPAVVELGFASPTVLQAPSKGKIEGDYQRLLDLRASLASSGIEASVEQIEDATIANTMEKTRALEADLIVVGSHHHSALYQLFVGTFTGDVLKHATCPVLVVPAAQKERA